MFHKTIEILTQTTQTDVEREAAARVIGETEAEAGTEIPGTSKAITDVDPVLRMKITDETRPRGHRLVRSQMRHGDNSRICILIGEGRESGIGLHM